MSARLTIMALVAAASFLLASFGPMEIGCKAVFQSAALALASLSGLFLLVANWHGIDGNAAVRPSKRKGDGLS